MSAPSRRQPLGQFAWLCASEPSQRVPLSTAGQPRSTLAPPHVAEPVRGRGNRGTTREAKPGARREGSVRQPGREPSWRGRGSSSGGGGGGGGRPPLGAAARRRGDGGEEGEDLERGRRRPAPIVGGTGETKDDEAVPSVAVQRLPEDDAESTGDAEVAEAFAQQVKTRRALVAAGAAGSSASRGLLYYERVRPAQTPLGTAYTRLLPDYDAPWLRAAETAHLPRAPSAYPLWPVVEVLSRGNVHRFGAVRGDMGDFRFWWEPPSLVGDEPLRVASTARYILRHVTGKDAVYLSAQGGSHWSAGASMPAGETGLARGTVDAADGLYTAQGTSTWDADVRRALRLARAHERGVSKALLAGVQAANEQGWVVWGGSTREYPARGATSTVWLPPHVGPVDVPVVVGGSGDVNTQVSAGASAIATPHNIPPVLKVGSISLHVPRSRRLGATHTADESGDVILESAVEGQGGVREEVATHRQRPFVGDAGDVTAQAAAAAAAAKLRKEGRGDAAAAEAAAALLSGTRSRLHVHIDRVVFDDHALASEEDWLAAKLRADHAEYARRVQEDVIAHCDARLAAVLPLDRFLDAAGREVPAGDILAEEVGGRGLSRAAARMGAPVPQVSSAAVFGEDDDMSLLLRAQDAVRALSTRQEEWVHLGRMATGLYSTWRAMKEVRRRDKVVRTPVYLQINRVGGRSEGSRSAAGTTPRGVLPALEVLLERLKTRFVNPAAVAARANAEAHHERAWERQRAEGGEEWQGGDEPPPLPPPAAHWNLYPNVAALVRAGEELLLRLGRVADGSALGTVEAGGIGGDGKDYALQLGRDETILTPDTACPPGEAARRLAAARTRIYTRVLVNGKLLTDQRGGGLLVSTSAAESRAVSLRTPGFVAEVGQDLVLQPYMRPSTLEVEIWQRGGDMAGGPWFDTKLSTVLVPLPGADTEDGAPTQGVPPVRGTFEFACNKELVRHEEGRVARGVAWQGVLPPTRPPRGEAEGGSTPLPAPAPSEPTYVDRRYRGVIAVHLEWAPGTMPPRPVRIDFSSTGRITVTGVAQPWEGKKGRLHFNSALAPSQHLLVQPVPVGGVNHKLLVGPWAADPNAFAPGGVTWDTPARRAAEAQEGGTGQPTTPGRRTRGGVMHIPDPNDPRKSTLALLQDGTTEAGTEGGPGGASGGTGPDSGGLGKRGEIWGPTGPLMPFREAALQHAVAFLAPALAAGTGLSLPEAVGGGSLGAVGRAGGMVVTGGGLRHRLLRLRATNPDAFRREWDAPIPLTSAEINEHAALKRLLALEAAGGFKPPKKRSGAEALGFAFGEGQNSVSALMAARAKARAHNYLSRIKATPSGKAKYEGGGTELSRLVRDVRLPTLGALDLSALGDIFKPKRSLHPNSSRAPSAAASLSADAIRGTADVDSAATKYKIKIHLVRALNMPHRSTLQALGALGDTLSSEQSMRRSATGRGAGLGGGGGGGFPGSPGGMPPVRQHTLPGGPGADEEDLQEMARPHHGPANGSTWAAFNEASEVWSGGADDVQVRCVAVASFGGAEVTSLGAVGPTPTWNQVLELPLNIPGDTVTPTVLAGVADPLNIALFDEVVVESAASRRARSTTKTVREKRFLGNLSIPFDALYAAGKVEAHLRLALPGVLFGYAPRGAGAVVGESRAAAVANDLPDSRGLLLAAETNAKAAQVFCAISVDPPLPGPPPMDSAIDDLFGSSWFNALQRANRRARVRRQHAAIAGPALALGPSPSRTATASPSGGGGGAEDSGAGSGGEGGAGAAPAPLSTTPSVLSDSDYKRVLSEAYSWAVKLATRTGRHVQSVVEDIEKQPRLITQYITPLQPPPHPDTAHTLEEGGLTRTGSAESEDDWRSGGASGRFTAASGAAPAGQVGELGEELLVGPPMETAEEVVRFVSLVPFLSDIDVFGRHADIWATCAQALDMGAGDFEEHALLLLNYLLWLNQPENGGSGAWRDYLLLGHAKNVGDTAWVARYFPRSNQTILINPCSGRTYLSTDSACPLDCVGMVASDTNLWANVQRDGEPWKMRWDVSATRDWVPLWPAGSDMPLPPTVQEPIVYTRPNPAFVEQLQDDIAERLQREFQSWRTAEKLTTRLTFKFTDKLHDLLGSLEDLALLQGVPLGVGDGGRGAGTVARTIVEHAGQLSSTLSRHEITGFPLCVPFRDLAEIVSVVKASGLHDTEVEGVEFAVECRVVAYANYVMAVWLYLLAVRPK